MTQTHTPTMVESLTEIWQRLLGHPSIGVDDNFFDLGGDSLLITRVLARIRQALKTNLSLVDMYQYPTINALARHLTQPVAESAGLAAVQNRASLQRAALARPRQSAKRS